MGIGGKKEEPVGSGWELVTDGDGDGEGAVLTGLSFLIGGRWWWWSRRRRCGGVVEGM